MSKTICKAKTSGEVRQRGIASMEWRDKDGKPQYYCYGYKDLSTEEPLPVCMECRDNVLFAQEDLDRYIEQIAAEKARGTI